MKKLLYLRDMLITFVVIQLGIVVILGLTSFIVWKNVFPEYMKNFGETIRITLLFSVLLGWFYRMSKNSTDKK